MNQSPPETGAGGRFRFHGRVGELYGIWLANLLLKALTLGIYHFWAKTRLRRYLWSQTSFDGERFLYTGTARELLKGYLKAVLLLIPLLLLLNFAAEAAQRELPALSALLGLLSYFGVFGFGGLARYASRRYRLSRTRWRGIRFALSGSAAAYGVRVMGHALLAGLTLGLTYPVLRNDLVGHQIARAWFGTARMEYAGRARDLYRPFLWRWGVSLTLIGALPLALALAGLMATWDVRPAEFPVVVALPLVLVAAALAALWLGYLAIEWRYIAARTRLRELRFALPVSGGQVAWLYGGNLALLALSLGLAYPYVVARSLSFLCARLEVSGTLDAAAVAQGAEEATATGEGLMDILDVGDLGV